MRKINRGWLMLIAIWSMTAIACGFGDGGGGEEETAVTIPRNATAIEVSVNAGSAQWLHAAAQQFNDAEIETSAGDQVFAIVTEIEAGDAAARIAQGEIAPDLWIPDDKVWANVAADQGAANYQSDCVSLAETPLVIGMWQDVASTLGWPGRSLGWLDVGSLAADDSAWSYYSGGQFGDSLRLGHTHPGLSGSGASTLLAIVQSAESKTEAVTTEDIQQPIVQASVGAFEGAVSWFSQDTTNLATTMSERGVQYLGAAIMYESTVLNYGNGNIVPIYPFEGTFMATNPGCVRDGADAGTSAAAQTFRDWLLGNTGQNLAVANGLRAVNQVVAEDGLALAASAADLSQPEIVFASPTVESIYAIQELWQSARKPVHLVMLIDTSGSMRGDKMDNVRAAAAQFVTQMGKDDILTLYEFATEPYLLGEYQPIEANRDALEDAVLGLYAQGDTSLYDAIGVGSQQIDKHNSPRTANALVVLTDGQDTSSYRWQYNRALADAAAANDTTVFAIAYGRDADIERLEQIALAANGKFFLGDEANIGAIYEEMSAAFGGSVGIGR